MYWQTTRFQIDLAQPRIMGIVNVTPDSFADGGQHATVHSALSHCEQLLRDGAHILDIGGESSRPGAVPLALADELARVIPVVQGAVKLGVPVSVDTYKPQVMQAALDAGADIINDIWALRQPGALDVVAAHPCCGVVLMHMHRDPQTMQTLPMQEDAIGGDVVSQVHASLLQFIEQTMQQIRWRTGDSSHNTRIAIDAGIGFGKTVAQNFLLLSRQAEFASLGCPVVAGWSRKSSLGAVTGLEVGERMLPSVVAAVLAVERGANVVRVHDVRETALALRVLAAVV